MVPLTRTSPFLLRRIVAVALVAGGSTGAAALTSPNGDQFQIHVFTTGTQGTPSVAAGAAGSFVVVWYSYGSSGTDQSDASVQMRRFDANGAPLGGETQVNEYTTNEQRNARVASDPFGNFVVVWESDGSAGGDTNQRSIQARRYSASGAPLGSQFQVNDYTTGSQSQPAVAVDGGGEFIVAWQSLGSPGGDDSQSSIQARRFDAAGTPAGGQFQVNTITSNAQLFSAIGATASGQFIVAWSSFGSGGSDTSANSIQARRYDENGVPQGAEFQVNQYTTGYQFNPDLAVSPQGEFAIVWGSTGSYGDDAAASSIQIRRFDASGAPLDDQLQVNSYTTMNQHQPRVGFDGQGRFVVVWQSEGSAGTDTEEYSIQVQRFALDGSPLDGEAQVNTYTTMWQGGPSVAADAAGNFLVVWESAGSWGSDNDSSSAQARRYDGLFRDGFESSGTARWSSTVP